MVDTVRTQQELLDRMKINVAGVQVGRRADINVQTFRDFVVSIPTLGAPGLSNIVEDLTPQLGGALDMNNFDIACNLTFGPAMRCRNRSSTVPTFVPAQADDDTGLGGATGDALSAIAGGAELMRWTEDSPGTGDKVEFLAPEFRSFNLTGPLLHNLAASGTQPTLVPRRDGPTTGIGALSAAALNAIVVGSSKMQWGTSITTFAQSMAAAASGGPQIRNNTATVTGPVFNPHSSLPNSGMGGDASGNVSMITNALERMRFSNAGLITFFQDLQAGSTPGALIKAGLVSSTNPSIAPSHLDPDTGLGICGANCLALIAGGINVMQMTTGELNVSPAAFTIRGSDAAAFALRNVAASATVPTLIPNRVDFTTGYGSSGSGQLNLIVSAISRMNISSGVITMTVPLQMTIGSGPAIQHEASSLINPTLLPDKGNSASGIGGTSGSVAMIAGATNRINVDATGIGFFATTPAARPTGVAVTAAAIHAALVTLGLITA